MGFGTEEEYRHDGLKNLALMFIMCEDFRHRGAKRKRTNARDMLKLFDHFFPVRHPQWEINLDNAVEVLTACKELLPIPDDEAQREAFFQSPPEPHCAQVAGFVLAQRARKKLTATPQAKSSKKGGGGL